MLKGVTKARGDRILNWSVILIGEVKYSIAGIWVHTVMAVNITISRLALWKKVWSNQAHKSVVSTTVMAHSDSRGLSWIRPATDSCKWSIYLSWSRTSIRKGPVVLPMATACNELGALARHYTWVSGSLVTIQVARQHHRLGIRLNPDEGVSRETYCRPQPARLVPLFWG